MVFVCSFWRQALFGGGSTSGGFALNQHEGSRARVGGKLCWGCGSIRGGKADETGAQAQSSSALLVVLAHFVRLGRLATKVDREFELDFVFAQYSRAYFCFTLACVREGVVLMMMWVGTVVFRWETNDAIA